MNILAKQLIHLADAHGAGILMGARMPISDEQCRQAITGEALYVDGGYDALD